jgi:uncharacterized protein YcfJ
MKLKYLSLIVLLLLSVVDLSARSNVAYVKVEKSEPVYRTVNVRIPYEEVISKAYVVRVPCGQNYQEKETNSLGIDTLIGAGIGLAIGNQVGSGSGRDVAKAVGGLSGAYVANQNRDGEYSTQYCNETRYKDEVITKYDYVSEEKITGYKNTFIYDGKEYTKVSKHPLREVKVTTSISF